MVSDHQKCPTPSHVFVMGTFFLLCLATEVVRGSAKPPRLPLLVMGGAATTARGMIGVAPMAGWGKGLAQHRSRGWVGSTWWWIDGEQTIAGSANN